MIELRWRKADSVSHPHGGSDGISPATIVTTCGERQAMKSAAGEWMVLQYKWTVVPGETGLVVPMSSDWEDVPVER
jgi:hypothetical protein